MLLETIEYLTTPCPKHIRKMGYLKQLIAFKARYKRCKNEWHEHIKNCHVAIKHAMNQLSQHRTVLVLGGGTLYDIPIKTLSLRFENVIIVDVLFSRAVIAYVKRYDNVTLEQNDVTESIFDIYQNKNVIVKQASKYTNNNEIDLVISANIASQLTVMPSAYLLKNNIVNKETIDEFSKTIIENHLSYLKSFRGKALLISDKTNIFYDQFDKIVEQTDALYGIKIENIDKSWLWNIAPDQEISKAISQKNEVISAIF